MPKSFHGSTPFKDYIVPEPDQSGDGVAVRNGIDDFEKKGTKGEVDEVTFESVEGAPGPGESSDLTRGGNARKP